MAFSRMQTLESGRSFKAASAFSPNVASITAIGRAMPIPPSIGLIGGIISYILLHVNTKVVLLPASPDLSRGAAAMEQAKAAQYSVRRQMDEQR
jgi:hypothetical protein